MEPISASSGSSKVDFLIRYKDQLSLYESAALSGKTSLLPAGTSDPDQVHYTSGTWSRVLEIISR